MTAQALKDIILNLLKVTHYCIQGAEAGKVLIQGEDANDQAIITLQEGTGKQEAFI